MHENKCVRNWFNDTVSLAGACLDLSSGFLVNIENIINDYVSQYYEGTFILLE